MNKKKIKRIIKPRIVIDFSGFNYIFFDVFLCLYLKVKIIVVFLQNSNDGYGNDHYYLKSAILQCPK